jgi:ABC-2 type transport system permease protein
LQYFLVIVRGIFLKGTGLGVLWPQLLGLAILGLLVFPAAVNRFRTRVD